MFYQEVLPKLGLYSVSIACLNHRRTLVKIHRRRNQGGEGGGDFINIHTCSADHCILCMPRARGGCLMRQTSLLGFYSIGCVGREEYAPVDSNAGEPTRSCTSGIDCFGAEDGASVLSALTNFKAQLCCYSCIPRTAVYR